MKQSFTLTEWSILTFFDQNDMHLDIGEKHASRLYWDHPPTPTLINLQKLTGGCTYTFSETIALEWHPTHYKQERRYMSTDYKPEAQKMFATTV